MRFVAVDWGTSRFRALLAANGRILERRETDHGIARLRAGDHAAVFERAAGAWLAREPDLPVLLVGMVGSREGWAEAPYARCPAGPREIAAALAPVDLGQGRRGAIVPGLRTERDGAVDVMRGEETHLLGAGVADGLVCLPGTHCKWARVEAGRVADFATFLTGELYGLLREQSMVGRPAREPADPAGFALGLAAARDEAARPGGGLLQRLFGARAAAVTGRLAPEALGPYLSGLLTGFEIAGALKAFDPPAVVTVVADPPRAALYEEALAAFGLGCRIRGQDETLLAGLARLVAERF
ncbi:MAG: 2-dehydro-3-deoxygalactonokinase [Methylobacteriaceae bacterium]|nr:2-dehydro-3-deoxygalactonokinase [Methylobacteriaceae bacterium]